MPIYTYMNNKTGETVDVVQGMNEKHEYFVNGMRWKRIYTLPRMSMDTKIDPFDRKQFIEKTSNKRGTMGDLYDRSAELSEARKDKLGTDPVKEQFFETYKKERNGIEHQAAKREKALKAAEKAGLKVTFNRRGR